MNDRGDLYYEHGREVTPSPHAARADKRWTMISGESVEKRGLENGTMQELQDFLGFIAANEEQIDTLVRQGLSLADIFYNNFYSEDRPNRKFVTNPQTRAMQSRYNHDAWSLAERFHGFSKNYTKLAPENRPISSPEIGNGWMYFNTFGGVKAKERLGRIYLNIKPEHVVTAYEQLLPQLAYAQARTRSKIESSIHTVENSFNRYDKMVVYFNDGEDAKVWQVINAFSKQHPSFFEAGTPRFTAPVMDERGKPLLGVAFAEEPNAAAGGQSNGEIISAGLEEVYKNWKRDRSQTAGDMVAAFKRACMAYGRDASNPAFNADTLRDRAFGTIRRQIDMKSNHRPKVV